MKYLIFGLLFITACGKSNLPIANKELYSQWVSDSKDVYDLTSGINSPTGFTMTMTLTDQRKCTCLATITGTESSGKFDYFLCTFIASSGGSDPGCGALSIHTNYINAGAVLNVCTTNLSPNSCENFK